MQPRTMLAAAATLIIGFGATAPAFALCDACSATVRFDDSLASCFSMRLDDELKTLTTTGKTLVIVNLKDCATRALPTAAPTDAPVLLDTEFAADAQSLKCLDAKISALPEGSMSPSYLFDLTKDCPAN